MATVNGYSELDVRRLLHANVLAADLVSDDRDLIDVPTQDPRWEWIEVPKLGDPTPRFARGRCNHLDVEPVVSGGQTVAHLCLTCDAQLPDEWRP